MKDSNYEELVILSKDNNNHGVYVITTCIRATERPLYNMVSVA